MRADDGAPTGGERWPAVRPGRAVTGMSAILLPFTPDGRVDWPAFAAHVERTAGAGLVPALNMDTGYVQLLDAPTRRTALDIGAEAAGSVGFVAGACPAEAPDATWSPAGHEGEIAQITARGGTPVVFPTPSLTALDGEGWVAAHRQLAEVCDRFIAFELGSMFVPHGRIYDLDTYQGLLEVPACIGAKHSSLSRVAEWDRLSVRDRCRPDFLVLTGNDLAIDMIMYGSDYLLGLSTFAPQHFARRDALWRDSDPAVFELNDLLQYLGQFAFRAPVPAYKHDAAMVLALRGWASSDRVAPGAPERPASDREVLADIVERLEAW